MILPEEWRRRVVIVWARIIAVIAVIVIIAATYCFFPN
jgi:hypothetical protein